MPAQIGARYPNPLAMAHCLAANSGKNTRPRSGEASCFSHTAKVTIADHAAWNVARMKIARGRRAENINIGQYRHIHPVQPHVLQQLVHLARVVTDLVDDESGASRILRASLKYCGMTSRS